LVLPLSDTPSLDDELCCMKLCYHDHIAPCGSGQSKYSKEVSSACTHRLALRQTASYSY
jgi:hypothetical protein